MLVDRVIRRWEGVDAGRDADRLDAVELAWDECHRRAVAKSSRRGRPVRLLLRLGTVLRHHDVLVDEPGWLLVVEVRPTDVIVVRPRSMREAAVVAAEWGNLHVPVQPTDDELITLADGPAEVALHKHHVPFTVEPRRFEPMPVSGIGWTVAKQDDA